MEIEENTSREGGWIGGDGRGLEARLATVDLFYINSILNYVRIFPI